MNVAQESAKPLLQRLTTRRGLFGALVAGGTLGGVAAGTSIAASSTAAGVAAEGLGAARKPPAAWAAAENYDAARNARQVRDRIRRERLPNVQLVDDRGRKVRFYDDIVRDRVVVINAMYTVCGNICTPATRNLMEARELLGDLARGIRFVSMTLTPLIDGPGELAAFKKMHGIGDDWTFLTGSPDQVERVQKAMGMLSSNPEDDLLAHSALAVVVDERNSRWTHANTLTPAKAIARMIRYELV